MASVSASAATSSVLFAKPLGNASLLTTSVAAGTMVFSTSNYTVAQNGGSVQVTVLRTGGATGKVNVTYATASGSAIGGTDYTVKSGTLYWNRGDSSPRSFSVNISNAVPFSGTKSFTVRLTAPQGGSVLGTPSTSTITINGSKTTTVDAQPYIQDFNPKSGPVGTVVTISGNSFTGLNAAWVGSAHDASLVVSSDTQAQVTIPADATTGAIGLLNNSKASFTASSFSVTTGTSGTGGSTGTGGTGGTGGTTTPPASTASNSVRVQGARFIDASGNTLQLRGANYSGYEFGPIQGWTGTDPSGGQAGQPGGPNYAAMQAWKINTIRIPLNEASWLGYSCTDAGGKVHNPDPAGNYKSSVIDQVAKANAAGLYVIIDLHWTAPGTMCPMLQTQMADADHSLAFWTSVANQFKSNPSVLFELFNEPFLNFDFSGDTWAYMMKGVNGSFSGYPATGSNGAWVDVKQPWAIASYQQMINAVRATGATNVVLVGSMQYDQEFSGWLANRPTDPLNQMAAVWHPYPTYGTTWGTSAYAQPNYGPDVYNQVVAIQAAGIPVIATETGDRNTAGTVGAPLVSNITAFADQYGVSLLGWAWDVWGASDNVLIKDANGTPTDGYGKVFHDWLLAH